jgi:uncharacterized protein (DUF1697 family)
VTVNVLTDRTRGGRIRRVAFVRNVMIGREGLTRDVLLRVFLDAGADAPVSHLATGNVSFGLAGPCEHLREAVESGLARVLGRPEPVFIRTLAALRREVRKEPFADPPFDDVYERCVSLTDEHLNGLALPLTNARGDVVVFAVRGREVYSVTRRIDGRAGTPSTLLRRVLTRPFSNRNWNTIEHIVRRDVPSE